jgi:hypothetical protein
MASMGDVPDGVRKEIAVSAGQQDSLILKVPDSAL